MDIRIVFVLKMQYINTLNVCTPVDSRLAAVRTAL